MQYPRYAHDCEHCVFLGTLEYGAASVSWSNPDSSVGGALTKYVDTRLGADVWDLYYCNRVVPATVIARYGNHGTDYKSGLQLAALDEELRIAKQLAEERGLIDAG